MVTPPSEPTDYPEQDFPAAEGEDVPETVVTDERSAALIERLGRERDDAIAAYKRSLADFANFQRRSNENEIRSREAGIAEVARLLMPVLDQIDLALALKPETVTKEQLLAANEMLRSELSRALMKAGIDRIDPKPGDEFDPHLQEAVMQMPVAGVAAGHVAQVFQVGYRLSGMRLRPAKVAVTPA
jgi:molecular chaperone GrpE